ncbi:MAG: hypothetical protein RLZ95_1434 [Bacteroidota bacterium]|jgi:uncharacterized protein (DUF1684 family)
MKKIVYIIFAIAFLNNVHAQELDYLNSIEQWHQKRIVALKQPDGWLNLEGLFWLHKGKNSFGSAQDADCHYDNMSFPALLGNFIYEGDSVIWENGKTNAILIDKIPVELSKSYKVFDLNGKEAIMDWEQFSWVVIKREDKVGIRFRNLNAKTLQSFKGIERFPVQSKWRIQAKLIQPRQNFLMITNVLGQTVPSKNAGTLIFEISGVKYSLDVLDETGPNLFIVFADQTSGKTTYGAGRFIDIPKPDAAGNTIIDFNNAYNPPCAFTAFATCPLPPEQNRLSVKIEAGEKNYGHH